MNPILKAMGYGAWSKSSVEKKSGSMTLGTSQSLGSFLMFGSNSAGTPASAISLYRQSTAVSVPINRIAAAVAGMDLVIELEDGTIKSSHKALDLLRKPSPFYSKSLFLETMAKNFLITGEADVVAIGGVTRPPLELQPISPDKITVPKGSNGLPTSLIVTGETLAGQYPSTRLGSQIRYIRDPLTEISMTRNFSTRDNSLLRGESLLMSAASEVRQHILGGQHNVSLLEKGGRVSLVFHFKEDMTTTEFETAKERVRSQYGGAQKAGEIGVTAGDGALEIKEVGAKNTDMDFVVLQKMAKISVANQYSFPLVLLDSDSSTFNNYSTGKEALYDDAALPIAEILLNSLTDFLMPRYGEDPAKVKFAVNLDTIPALAMRRNKELKLRKEIGIESTNELRSFLSNREDIAGGDDIYIPANLVPIGEERDDDGFNPSMDTE